MDIFLNLVLVAFMGLVAIIAGIFEDVDGAGLVGREKLDVVSKAHKVGPYLL